MTLTVEQAARATRGELRNAERFPQRLRVVTDTRSIQSGDTFLALRGERFNGHDYVRDALAKGAAAIVVDDPQALVEGVPALAVGDTKRAYMDLAGAARELFGGQVVGITGSAGKTTTKHLLAQLLSDAYGSDRVLASPANENNEIGVSKLLLAVQPEQRYLVVEMGARHEGEIAELAAIARPQTGILTNIGEAHLEIFGSRERLARTKWGLFEYGARAVLNANDRESLLRAPGLTQAPFWFAAGDAAQRDGLFLLDAHTLIVRNGEDEQRHAIDLRLPGRHNAANLAGALAAAFLLGVPAERLVRSIPLLTLPAGRYEKIELASGTRLIYDAYNANASGMIAALDAFAGEPAQSRIAVLSSMAELGQDAPAMHERVGAHAASLGIDMVLAGGEFAASFVSGALAAGLPPHRAVTFGNNAEAAEWLRAHAGARDVVLLKGSRKYKMEEIVTILRDAEIRA